MLHAWPALASAEATHPLSNPTSNPSRAATLRGQGAPSCGADGADWIPAYAGMTDMGVGSRFRGNDVAPGATGRRGAWRPICGAVGADWIPAYAGMTAWGRLPHPQAGRCAGDQPKIGAMSRLPCKTRITSTPYSRGK